MQDIYISLGSNQGVPTVNLDRAVLALCDKPGLTLIRKSSQYQTEPQEFKNQPWFTNQVVWMSADKYWTPEDLLSLLKKIETDLGRVPGPRYGPRLIDLDILLFGNLIHREKRLILPHPGLAKRAFILIPLLEISPELALPDGSNVKELLNNLDFTLQEYSIFQT